MKLNGINWLLKKKQEKPPIKKCLTCDNLARNRCAKYCLDCSHKRAVANNSKQSLRRYHKKKLSFSEQIDSATHRYWIKD